MSGEQILGLAGRLVLLLLSGALLLLNAVGLPGNWILLALAAGYSLITHFEHVGWGTLGAFVGGLAGAIASSTVAPPVGAFLGAFAGTFAGAFLFEYMGERRRDRALRAGRAALVGRALAAVVKTTCGFWMWVVFAYKLLVRG